MNNNNDNGIKRVYVMSDNKDGNEDDANDQVWLQYEIKMSKSKLYRLRLTVNNYK